MVEMSHFSQRTNRSLVLGHFEGLLDWPLPLPCDYTVKMMCRNHSTPQFLLIKCYLEATNTGTGTYQGEATLACGVYLW